MLALEHLRLQQLQDPQHVEEEGQVVLLPKLLEIEVGAAVQERGDHGQVPGGDKGCSWVVGGLAARPHRKPARGPTPNKLRGTP